MAMTTQIDRAVRNARLEEQQHSARLAAEIAELAAINRTMLAALRIALDHMTASIDTCRRAPGDIALVRAAIAKAEGRG